jgi:hypothetical protein
MPEWLITPNPNFQTSGCTIALGAMRFGLIGVSSFSARIPVVHHLRPEK